MILVFILLTQNGSCQNQCEELKCGRHGPVVRFPFRIKDRHPVDCGYPGFDITCSDHDQLLLDLPTPSGPVSLSVRNIYYRSRKIELYDPQSCLQNLFYRLHNYSKPSTFKFESSDSFLNIAFLNCSDNQDMFSCPIHVAASTDQFLGSNILFCTKMIEISSNQLYNIQKNALNLSWSKPNCTRCEIKGQMCKLKNNGTKDDIECLDYDHKKQISTRIAVAVTTSGSVMILLVLVGLFLLHRHFKLKGEDRVRLEKFLEDYRSLKPTRFSYADLHRMTSGFKDTLGEGAHGSVFKGKLSEEILVAVKMLNNSEVDHGKEFINEVGAIGKIHHVNVVRLLGFCADGFHQALVYDFFPNGSLQRYVSAPNDEDNTVFLGWENLQQIAIGIAKGIEYLHKGCDPRIIHFDINPHNVLLEENFLPKISDFGLAKLYSKDRSAVSMTTARGTLGYIAPEVFSKNFGNVTHKADIYSYGMLLIEMVSGRKNTNTEKEGPQVLYPEWIHNLVKGGDVHIQIGSEEDIRIAKKLAIVGLWCIQWNPADRPSIKTVLQMLEGGADNLTAPQNPLNSPFINTSVVIPSRHINSELEVIHESD